MKQLGHWFHYGLLRLRPAMKSVPAVLWIPQLPLSPSLSYCSTVINDQQQLGSKLAEYTGAGDKTSDDQKCRFSLIRPCWWKGRSPFYLAGGPRFQKRLVKMEPEDEPVSIFVQRNEAGVAIDDNSIIKTLWEYENGQRGWVKMTRGESLLRLCNVWPWNSRRLLCITVAEQRCQIIQQPPYCCCCSLLLAQLTPAPPPPLCCQGNTHTEQSGRPMLRARCRGCCSDCRCISQHPPAWPGRW